VPRAYALAAAGRSPAALAALLRQCVDQAERLFQVRQRQWAEHRPGVLSTGNRLESYWTAFRQNLADFADAVAEGSLDGVGLLTVEYFLPDAFSAQWVTLAVRYAPDDAWTTVVDRDVPKPLFFQSDDEYEHSGYLRVSYPLAAGRTITHCRIESWGYGGIGIRCLQFRSPAAVLAPCAVTAVSGVVAAAQHVLDTSSSWCWLGEPDTGLAFRHPGLGRVRHSLTLSFGSDRTGPGGVG
jgi:hypothetical protein